jgi:hypothetical protein
MAIRIGIRIVLVVGVVLAISYFFSASFYLALVIVAVFGVFGEVIHMPENMPGECDNPEGKDLHPAKAIILGALAIAVLVGIGHLFPELYNYGFSKNS